MWIGDTRNSFWVHLAAFVSRGLIRLDPKLTIYYHASRIQTTRNLVNFIITTTPSFSFLKKNREHRANIISAGIRYGLRYGVFYDETVEEVGMDDTKPMVHVSNGDTVV